MSTPEPNPAPHDPEADEDAAEATPGQVRRGISEWAVVLALVALIVAVAWSQFGALFSASTQGTDGSAPSGGGLEVEGEGFTVGGTPMSALTEDGPSVNTVRSRDDSPSETGEPTEPTPRDTAEPSGED